MCRTIAVCLIGLAGMWGSASGTPLVVASVAPRHHCLEIPAMRTSEAAAAVTGALRSLPGVVGIAVDPRTQLAVVRGSTAMPTTPGNDRSAPVTAAAASLVRIAGISRQ